MNGEAIISKKIYICLYISKAIHESHCESKTHLGEENPENSWNKSTINGISLWHQKYVMIFIDLWVILKLSDLLLYCNKFHVQFQINDLI